MANISKEKIAFAVKNAIVALASGVATDNDEKGYTFLVDENGEDLTNSGDFSLVLTVDNGELVVSDVYPGRVYAKIKIGIDWTENLG